MGIKLIAETPPPRPFAGSLREITEEEFKAAPTYASVTTSITDTLNNLHRVQSVEVLDPTLGFFHPIGMENQSGTIADATILPAGKSVSIAQQQMTFHDQDEGFGYEADSGIDNTRYSRDEQVAHYRDFLKRPIKLNAYKWQLGQDFSADINPWDDYLTNSRISNRIAHFNLLRGKLCVKFVLSGTGFHYGRILASYMPLHRFDDLSGFSNLIPANLIQQSQLQKVFLNPTTNAGGTLCLPFMWHEDYVDIPARDWLELGNLQLRSLGALKHANAGTDDVTVTVFAWMEEISLSIPTSVDPGALGPQAGEIDEANANGCISGPATKVAGIAAGMSSVPIIGPYASATSTVAAGVAGVAKLMGLSRPPQTQDVAPYKPEPVSSLALTTVPDRSAKLTLDDKQELSIDPIIAGVGSTDPLDILAIAQKESYFTSFTWDTGLNTGDALFNVRVQPTLWGESDPGLTPIVHLTATGFASLPFHYWSGTLKFRFQIVASAYHKGRLRVVYDPNFIRDAAGDDFATNYTQIIDLGHSQDFTISCPPGQPTSLLTHYLPGRDGLGDCYAGSTGPAIVPFTTVERYKGNGVLGIYILNELVTPNSAIDNSVRVNVFVSAGDDFEVFQPDDYLKNFEFVSLGFSNQSGEIATDAVNLNETDAPQQSVNIQMAPSYVSPRLHEVFMGEKVTSLRPLMKRFCRWHTIPLYTSESDPVLSPDVGRLDNRLMITSGRLPHYPMMKGDYTDAMDFAVGSVSGKYTYANMIWLHYVVAAFQGHRGSVRYKFIPRSSDSTNIRIAVERDDDSDGLSLFYRQGVDFNRTSSYAIDFATFASRQTTYDQINGDLENLTGLAGATVSTGNVNSAVEVESPYLSNFRFHPGKRLRWNLSDTDKYSTQGRLNYEFCSTFKSNIHDGLANDVYPGEVDVYVAAGEDYSTYCFTGMPPIRFRTGQVTP